MSLLTRSTLPLTLLASLAAGSAVGCEEKPSSPAPAASASAAAEPAIDPALAQAVAATRAAAPSSAAGAEDGDGPPPGGVFAPGAADKAMPKGAFAKLVVGEQGAEPRVTLGPLQPKLGTKLAVELVITRGQGQRQMPPFTFQLGLEAQKPAAADVPGAEHVTLLATMSSAKVDDPRVPKEQAAAVTKLKGTKLRFDVDKDGAPGEIKVELAKGADPDFGEFPGNVATVLGALSFPAPKEPVGVGAVWMVTTRERVLGVDVVSYRMVKVTKIEGDVVELEVAAKRYAASPEFDLPGAPKELGKLTLAQFQSVLQGTVSFNLKTGGAYPTAATLSDEMVAVLTASGGQQLQPVQLSLEATLSRR